MQQILRKKDDQRNSHVHLRYTLGKMVGMPINTVFASEHGFKQNFNDEAYKALHSKSMASNIMSNVFKSNSRTPAEPIVISNNDIQSKYNTVTQETEPTIQHGSTKKKSKKQIAREHSFL